MKKLIAFILLLSCVSVYAQKDNHITIGTVDTIYSKILNEKRAIFIHVPNGNRDERYPVLYILDGETHFESAVAIDEQMSGVTPPMIVVGITNTNRERDLTPTKGKVWVGLNESEAKASGGGENFMAFIEKELIPYIDSHYPAAPYRVFSGHSLGGLAVVNAFFNHTSIFNAYVAIDPSLWWEKQGWIKKQEIEAAKQDFANRSLFVAAANNIPPGMDTISILKDTGFVAPVTQAVLPFLHYLRDSKPKGLRWDSKFYQNERHGTVELNAEYDALRYLFNFYQFRTSQFIGHPELDEDAVIGAHYKMLSERMGYTVLPPESTINEMGYDCMARKKMATAYKLFKRNTDNHPDSANAFDSLGDYYSDNGDKKNAIVAYTKSLSLQETGETRGKLNELLGKK